MQKVLFSFVVFLSLAVVFSCNKDKDNETSIIGKWTLTSASFKYSSGGLSFDTTIAGDGTSSLEFKSDGTAISTDSTGTSSSTYNYNSSTKTLIETDDDSTITYNVPKLTSTNLQLHTEGTTDLNGLPFTYTADLYFKR